MEILCCPDCRGDLDLEIKERNDEEILRGGLHCKQCDFTFQISEGIPNLLPQELQRDQDAGGVEA